MLLGNMKGDLRCPSPISAALSTVAWNDEPDLFDLSYN